MKHQIQVKIYSKKAAADAIANSTYVIREEFLKMIEKGLHVLLCFSVGHRLWRKLEASKWKAGSNPTESSMKAMSMAEEVAAEVVAEMKSLRSDSVICRGGASPKLLARHGDGEKLPMNLFSGVGGVHKVLIGVEEKEKGEFWSGSSKLEPSVFTFRLVWKLKSSC